MRNFKVVTKVLGLIITAILIGQVTNGQENKKSKNQLKKEEIQNVVQSKNFVFVAQYANPIGGRQINLTSPYDVKLSSDTIVSDLPYYGRAFVAPMNPTEGGIHFTSTNFSYTIDPKKKGGWDVSVSPKDTRDVRQLLLSVSETGFANLQVISNNRQTINFTGYIISKSKFR